MIREEDVREAIAEMQGQRNPNANTCIKLAAYYTILDHLVEESVPAEEIARSPQQGQEPYSYSGADPEQILYSGDSAFAARITGKAQADVWPVIDELMTTIQVLNPRLYGAVMQKLE